ncbi:MAG: hypothetical protein MNSN_02500 [Minisyncoccus archaeiphilus]|uniref:LamG domain-containing protein n=1 Tax=Minisyncoccus archaeiphilus TaxID=3238481 RepID=UPI0009CDD102|nr:MAG: hypothetical protein BWY21_00475 [Parcubacteria group bacterium ADurb.Bin216]GMX59252.1 MAG: hypothetical protein MNSN_02500 [Candidatus Parcubacteria bacterium]
MDVTKNNNVVGFTLLEVMIAILIIGIIASITVVNHMDESRSKAEFANLKTKWVISEGKYIENLIGKWSFDEGSGTATKDSSTFEHNGTLTNGPVWKEESDCIFGKCLYFDGVDDYIAVGILKNIDFAENFTVGVWVNLNKFGDSRSNCGNKRANVVRVGSNPSGVLEVGTITSNRFWVTIRTTSSWIELITPGAVNQWTYLSVVNDKTNNQIRLFIDSKLKGQSSYTGLLSNKGGVNLGGTTPNCTYGYTQGLIDEVAIYNNVMSIAEIQSNYLAGINNLLAKGLITQEDYDFRIASMEDNKLANLK